MLQSRSFLPRMQAGVACKRSQWWPMRVSVVRRRQPFQLGQPANRVFAAVAAHVLGWLQAAAKRGPFRPAKDLAAVVVSQLYAAHARGFSIRHARNRAGDGRCGAAGAAGRTACQGGGG